MSFGQCLLFSARNSESCFVYIVAGKYMLVDMQLEFLFFSVFQKNVSRFLSVCLLNPFLMAALRRKCEHYIFTVWFLMVALCTRMWANAQRDGRPVEYRWRPLFNAAKFG